MAGVGGPVLDLSFIRGLNEEAFLRGNKLARSDLLR